MRPSISFQGTEPIGRPLLLEGPTAAGAAGLLGAVAGAETAIVTLLVVLVLGGTAGVRFEMIERFLEKQTTK